MNRKHIDLFSGIGGFSLAASWAGFDTLAHCEIEPYCRAVLAYRFAGVPICDDVRGFYDWFVQRFGNVSVDLVTYGFPCQDISCANTDGAGLAGERSGLWFAALDVIARLRPAYVVAENVRNLKNRGVDVCLAGLEAAGYEAAAFVVGAEDVGAPHERKRVFLVAERRDLADLHREREQQSERLLGEVRGRFGDSGQGGTVADAALLGRDERPLLGQFRSAAAGVTGETILGDPCRCGCSGFARRGAGAEPANRHARDESGELADADSWTIGATKKSDEGQGEDGGRDQEAGFDCYGGSPCVVGYTHDADSQEQRERQSVRPEHCPPRCAGGRQSEPGLGRTAHGVPEWLDRTPAAPRPAWPARKGEAQKTWEAPRLGHRIPYRAPRLEALGNALVPGQVYPVLAAIAERMGSLQ